LVVEELGIGVAGDGLVNLLLALAPQLPPLGMHLLDFVGPGGVLFAGDLPFFPFLTE
jgi:hypothetical protein